LKIFLFLTIFFYNLYGNTEINNTTEKAIITSQSKNIWIKTYQNYKNYNIVINNISKTDLKIKNTVDNPKQFEDLTKKLSIYKSKLELYDKNNNFDNIIRKFKYDTPNITLRDFIFKNSESKLKLNISKYITLKNDFYLAIATLQHNYNNAILSNPHDPKIKFLKDDLDYFNEYTENIEKIYQNLLESKIDLDKKYNEYQNDIFTKHIITLLIIVITYIIYKLLSSTIFYLTRNKENFEDQKNYKKLLSFLFIFSMLIFVLIRYIDDIIYIITFLSVVAAALTIAMREILLNIAGAIYIFFGSILKVGDRIMVQFETKHTIGDITDISLIKIKLNEVEDYTNLKEVKNVGRTIYIPNSYIFTKVFYNYSLKKNGIVNELLEFEFESSTDFKVVEEITSTIFTQLNLSHKILFNLNSTKTGIVAIISYQTNYKEASKNRSILAIALLEEYNKNTQIKIKGSKTSSKGSDEE